MQPAELNMILSTPSKHNASPHWNSCTMGFMPVRSAAIMNQQDSENKLEVALLEREEGEVIHLITWGPLIWILSDIVTEVLTQLVLFVIEHQKLGTML
jgi:hypothetical protein